MNCDNPRRKQSSRPAFTATELVRAMSRMTPRRVWLWAAAFMLVAGLTVFIFGQQRGQMANPQSSLNVPILTSGPQEEELPGLPDDWSFHHLTFTDPGSEEDAIDGGRHEEWLRIVNEPRYIIQQLKRRQPVQGPWADEVAKLNAMARAQEESGEVGLSVDRAGQLEVFPRPVKGHRPLRPVKAGIDRDWSMEVGAGAAASLTALVASTISSSNVSSSSKFTIDGQQFSASPPTTASRSGTFTGNPTNNQTLVIANPNLSTSLTLTASTGTPGTQTGTFGSVPTMANAATASITIGNSSPSNTLTVTTNATGANVGATWVNDPTTSTSSPYVKIGGVQTNFTISGSASTPAATPTFSGTTTAGTGVLSSGNTLTMTLGVNTLTLTAENGNATGTLTVSGTAGTGTNHNQLTVGAVTYTFASSCSGSPTSPCIVAGSGQYATAQNIEAAINNNTSECSSSGCFGDISAPNSEASSGAPSGGFSCTNDFGSCTLTITNNYYTSVNFSSTATHVTASGSGTIAANTTTNNECTSSTAGNFIIGSGQVGSAANLQSVISGCNSNYSLGLTVGSVSGSGFTITETTYGGGFGTGGSYSAFTWSATGGATGSPGCSGSSSPYTASYAAANTVTQLATNLVSAINACTSTSNPIYAVAGSSGALTIYNNVLGSASSTISTGNSSSSVLTLSGTINAGSTGSNTCNSTTAATFQVLSTDTTTTNIATEFVTAVNLCATANDATIGIATGSSAPNVTSSGATVKVTANQWVASPGITLGSTSGGPFSWTGGTSLTGGANGNSTSPHFAVDNILSDDAANLVGAITASGQGSSVGVTATQSGAGVTISASAAGSSGNAITLTNNLSNITLASPLAGGGNGTDSATTFAYWSGTTYDSQTQLATDIATALGDNSTITGAFTIDSVNSPAGDIVISYTAPGTAGNGQTLTTSSFSALTGGTFSGGTAAGLGAGQYPAKYGFSATTASCSDYVIYPTGATGSTSQATIVAYTNLYGSSSTGCGASPGGAVPEVYWAYNTPVTVSSTTYYGVATLSPVINWSGTQVAFVESVTVSGTTTAYLVLLRMTNSGSAVTTATSETAAQYYNSGSGCAAPCYTTFSLATTDTNSPPFYDYAHDAIYVGDDLGKVHQFTTVFNGTPTVGSGFPVQVSTETSKQLTGPVVDPSSALIFVSDNSGYLHSITSSGGNLLTSGQMDYNGGFTDAPLVDTASTAYVYTFGQHSTATYINAFATSSSINGSTGTAKQIGSYASTSLPVYDGAFDNQHSAYNNGHLYFCALSSSSSAAYPTLYQIAMGSSGLSNSTVTLWNTLTNGNATCSPVTEFYNSPTDYAYVSVTANGSNTDCTGACLYNFSLPTTGNGTAGAATAGLAVADGASGVIIDNNVASGTLAGASQIYFSSLGSETCSTSGGTGACAVQASQSNPSGPDYGTGSVTVNATDLGLTDGDTVTIGPTGSTIIYTAQADGNLCGSGPCFWDGGTTDTYAAESLYAAITNNPGNCPTANEGSHWTNTCFTNVTAANPYVSATWAGVTINLTNSLGSNLIFTTNNTSDITLVPNTGVLP